MKIIEPIHLIQQKLNQAFADEINKLLPRFVNNISKEIKKEFELQIKDSETYKSILNGSLQGHFGLRKEDAQQSLDGLVQIWLNEIIVVADKAKVVGTELVCDIFCYMIKDDFIDVLNSSFAINKTEDGDFPWLSWLIVEGDKIIVHDHRIIFNPNGKGGASRSGKAIMIPKEGGFWRVPPQYSGTLQNNWITRLLNEMQERISDIIASVSYKIMST